MGRHSTGTDPLDDVLKPPPDETPEAREIRLAEEENAKLISKAIDESIKAEKQIMKKKKVVRLLLLGQSESGMCTHVLWVYSLYRLWRDR
jgi:guanine nucleotide-binding protein subunit alpha